MQSTNFQTLSEAGLTGNLRTHSRSVEVSALHAKPDKRMALDAPIIEHTSEERMLEIMDRERLPSDVNQIMANAIEGDLREQGVLFETMLDTWPRLQGNMDEICGHVSRNEIDVEPFSEVGEDPTKSAVNKAAFIKQALEGMEVNYIHKEKDAEGTIYAIAQSYFSGHSVQEILWERNDLGLVPKSTSNLPWRNFGYPNQTDMIDRLMLNKDGAYTFNNLEDFPPHKFIVAIKQGHTGHASQSAPLRALMTYWLGSIYGLKWLLNFSQIYGVPIRWANYAEAKDIPTITRMMKTIGTSGYAVMPPNTKLTIQEATKSAQNLPQQALMDNADKACDIFILGQTLTSDVGSSGSQALGNVHNEIRLDVVDRVGDYVAKVLKGSLIKYLLIENYGDDSEMPSVTIQCKRSKDKKGMAETLKILSEALPDMEFSIEQIRMDQDLAKPINDEDSISGRSMAEEPTEEPEKKEKVEASHATIKAAEKRSNIDKLADNVMEELTGVSAEWLGGVKPFFMRIAALADSGQVKDEDLIELITAAHGQIPELFPDLKPKVLQELFEKSSGTAMMAGVEDSLGV